MQRVCWPCKNWDAFSVQELCTDRCNMEPCVIMLQHDVLVMGEWHISRDLCAFSTRSIKKRLGSLSIAHACPSINPTVTTGNSIRNTDISEPLISARCLTTAMNSENRDSTVKRTPLQHARHRGTREFARSSQPRRQTAVRWRSR